MSLDKYISSKNKWENKQWIGKSFVVNIYGRNIGFGGSKRKGIFFYCHEGNKFYGIIGKTKQKKWKGEIR